MGSKAFLKSLSNTSDKSDPEAKDRPPAPVIAITLTLLSSAAKSTDSLSSSKVAREIALCFSARLIVIRAKGPSVEYRIFSKLMFLPGLALIVCQRTDGPITFFEKTTYQSLLYLGPLQIGQINQKKPPTWREKSAA